MTPLSIFIGYDHRQPLSLQVLAHSIYTRASRPVAITPLVLHQLPISREGLTPFTWTRFLVPWLCGFQGRALFLDADMLVRSDIYALADSIAQDEPRAVWVRKSAARFEWASLMLFDCGHEANKKLTPEFVDETTSALHNIEWCGPDEIGDLPAEWNHLVLYDKPRSDAKLVHYTAGIPAFPELEGCEYAMEWHRDARSSMSLRPWTELMGSSVHVSVVAQHMRQRAASRDADGHSISPPAPPSRGNRE